MGKSDRAERAMERHEGATVDRVADVRSADGWDMGYVIKSRQMLAMEIFETEVG